ncbi:MAG: UxaA family hydrolase [Gammaproteobacteria bacterium]
MTAHYAFEDIGCLPMPGDNVAIASRRLEAGTTIQFNDRRFELSHTVMEGHRFAVQPIAVGAALLSWRLPFGHATRPIQPGDYLCNPRILKTLSERSIDFALPKESNFKDYLERYHLDETKFTPAAQVPRHAKPRTFMGYRRPGKRGVGTRNHIVILGTSSLTASYARALAEHFGDAKHDFPHCDGVVAVAHTEGATPYTPNNREYVLRVLAGFLVHPNVGAVLAVDVGNEVINNAALQDFMRAKGYALDDVIHRFLSLNLDFHTGLDQGAAIVDAWLPTVAAMRREEVSASHLNFALQCGGSDAFSGVSANPLLGWVAKESVRNGGRANLTETDELVGAESYVLEKTRDLATAQAFLECVERFKERAAWHGHTVEGNPSGGNQFRGLYNITLKSLGAARKKDPEVRLDYVIDYAEPMPEPGYYFMSGPGNDLEGIAGQVAAGCNMICFTTGNGSITNFPFVPTLKFVTTTGRWQMLADEMDVNAGQYQDGKPMDVLGQETYDLALKIASGQPSLGEKAGHSQVSIWRDWRQTSANPSKIEAILNAPAPAGRPLRVKRDDAPGATFKAFLTERGYATDRVGLVVPTSLCSGQIARMIATKLNGKDDAKRGVSRYVSLVHTEGCGAAPGYSQHIYLRTMLGHVVSPLVSKTLMLEHGCEQTHNDAMSRYLESGGVDTRKIGWASVQMDGGIAKVMDKAEHWFKQALAADGAPVEREVGLEYLRLGLSAMGDGPADNIAKGLALLARKIVNAGGLVIVPQNSALLKSRAFRETLLVAPEEVFSTLAYGQSAVEMGLHVMDTPTEHGVETLTGLGATGVEVMLSHQTGPLLQNHPLVPLLQVSADPATQRRFQADLDLALDAGATPDITARRLLEQVLEVASRHYTPKLFARGATDFQMTRGLLGLSL